MRKNPSPSVEARVVKGRYRKVEVRIWGDEKFRALSPIPPCGQGLWFYLIMGPRTGPIPGLFRAGRAGMAEDLNWDLEAFDKAFREAFAQGLVEVDFEARVVWIPNAIKHNRPESPNVVLSWASEFDLIPECDLKRQAFESLKASVHALGEAFAKAFDKAISKPSDKPLAKALPKAMAKAMPNQEQEQEQEQKKKEREKTTPDRKVEIGTWMANLNGEDAIPETDSIFAYADDAGIPLDFLALSWARFRDDMRERKTRKINWRAHYRNAVKGNWYKLWWFDQTGTCQLTTAGEQAKRAAA